MRLTLPLDDLNRLSRVFFGKKILINLHKLMLLRNHQLLVEVAWHDILSRLKTVKHDKWRVIQDLNAFTNPIFDHLDRQLVDVFRNKIVVHVIVVDVLIRKKVVRQIHLAVWQKLILLVIV